MLVLTTSGVTAQERPPNFTLIDISAGGLAIPGPEYDGLWEANWGLSGRVATPFYRGKLDFRIRAFENNHAAETHPEFLALHWEVGWGYTFPLLERVELNAGGRVGAMMMRFDDEEVFTGGLKNETELTSGLFVRIDAPVSGSWRVFAETEWAYMYLANPSTFTFVEAGMELRLDAPDWLRSVLR
ncbi:MAG: hypothetical protein R3284_08840 [Rubricoccaceae bacterium]|nr:hypothetical protein [Rubricoccaceae bacterium]